MFGKKIRFRDYRPDDIEAMFLLDLACFAPEFQFDRATMRQAAESPGAIVVIVEDAVGHAMVGFIIMQMEGDAAERWAYIVTIDVDPERRRGGIGKGMLNQAEEEAIAAGAQRIALHVAVDNQAAIRFYNQRRYTCVGVAKQFYREAGLDALVYAKLL